MISSVEFVLFAIVLVWLIVLTFLSIKSIQRFGGIFKNAKEQSLIAVLEKLVKENDLEKKELVSILGRLGTLEEKSLFSIQKVGLIRFNPFRDTGGEQSFILALLDAHNSGALISGLYARSGMRWYVKKIKHGKGIDHELSDEELKAIQAAE